MLKPVIRFVLTAGLIPFTAVSAQSTWVVDAAGGGDFVDLPPAVAAATPGDILIVHPGRYSATTIAVGLRIAGDPGAVVDDHLSIVGVPSGATCAIVGIACSGPVLVRDCGGLIHLDGVSGYGSTTTNAAGLEVARTSHLTVNGCFFAPASGLQYGISGTRIVDSVVSWTSSTTFGTDAWASLNTVVASTPALLATRSTLRLTNASLQGGNGFYLFGFVYPGASGLDARDCDVHIAGDARTAIDGGDTSNGGGVVHHAADAIAQGGNFVCDPDTGIGSVPGAASVVVRDLDAMLAQSAAPGGIVTWELIATPGALAGMLLSLPAAPVALPPLGELWLDPLSLVPIAATTIGSSAWTVSLTIPAGFPRAVPLVVQGRVDRAGVVTLTDAATFVVR